MPYTRPWSVAEVYSGLTHPKAPIDLFRIHEIAFIEKTDVSQDVELDQHAGA